MRASVIDLTNTGSSGSPLSIGLIAAAVVRLKLVHSISEPGKVNANILPEALKHDERLGEP
jgi:hypothetical protein